MGEHQLDKLGVTGSSPVPPKGKPAGNGGFFVSPSPAGATTDLAVVVGQAAVEVGVPRAIRRTRNPVVDSILRPVMLSRI